jgi:hypothetical protein
MNALTWGKERVVQGTNRKPAPLNPTRVRHPKSQKSLKGWRTRLHTKRSGALKFKFEGCATRHPKIQNRTKAGAPGGRHAGTKILKTGELRCVWNYLTCNSSLMQNPPTLMIPHLPTQGEGPAIQAPLPASDYVQPTLGHGLRIWWAFYWRNQVIAIILGLQLGAAIQWLIIKGMVPPASRALLIQAGSILLNYIPASVVLYFVFKKNFRSFRIRLTQRNVVESREELPLTPKRAFRIWWTYTWRGVVYLVVLLVATNVPLGFVSGAITVISPAAGMVFSQLMGFVIAGAVGLFVIYSNLLDEDIGDFHVGLVPRSAAAPIPQPGIANSTSSSRTIPQ